MLPVLVLRQRFCRLPRLLQQLRKQHGAQLVA
jgi:hypothetical protein